MLSANSSVQIITWMQKFGFMLFYTLFSDLIVLLEVKRCKFCDSLAPLLSDKVVNSRVMCKVFSKHSNHLTSLFFFSFWWQTHSLILSLGCTCFPCSGSGAWILTLLGFKVPFRPADIWGCPLQDSKIRPSLAFENHIIAFWHDSVTYHLKQYSDFLCAKVLKQYHFYRCGSCSLTGVWVVFGRVKILKERLSS